MVKTVQVIKARKQDSGKIVIIPINSAITFALLPEGTDEVRLGASWEGTFTVAEMMKLTVLPPVSDLNGMMISHTKLEQCNFSYLDFDHTNPQVFQ